MIAKNLISLFEDSFKQHWALPAMTNYEGRTYTFGEMAEAIDEWHLFFASQGLQHGDKVALMGKDTAEWAIFFLAVITYGAVIVPVLQDFPPADAMQIIDHSESKILGINPSLWEGMNAAGIPRVATILDFQDSHILHASRGTAEVEAQLQQAKADHRTRFPQGMRPEDVSYYQTPNEDLMVLNYTSGTTGFSKGVMLSGNNFAGNLTFCMERKIIKPSETLLCFLPMYIAA